MHKSPPITIKMYNLAIRPVFVKAPDFNVQPELRTTGPT